MISEIYKKVKFQNFVLTLSKRGIIIAKKQKSKIKYFSFRCIPIRSS